MLGVLPLAPWRRAWRLLWPYRAVWWSFAAVGTVLVLAFATTPLYLSAAASASVADQERGRCSYAAGLQASGGGPLDDPALLTAMPATIARSVLGPAAATTYAADGSRGHLGPPVVTVRGGLLDLLPGPHHQFEQTASLVYRDGALDHVQVVDRVPGDGFLVTREVAAVLEVRPGGFLTAHAADGRTVRGRVVGVYRDLARQPRKPFWCSLDILIHQRDPLGNNVPPPLLLATSPAPAMALLRQLHSSVPADLRVLVERPLLPGLRVDQAESALKVVTAAQRTSPGTSGFDVPQLRTELPYVVSRAHAVRTALGPPVTALAVGAGLAALGLVAVAGSFWAERRRTELDVLSVRGVGPAALAGKAVLECLPPLLAGLVAGIGLALAAIRALGPDGAAAPGAAVQGAGLAVLGGLLALGVLAVGVGLRRRAPRAPSARTWTSPSPVVRLGIELLALAASIIALGRINAMPVYADGDALPTFGLARLVLPLLVLVFVSVVLVRLLTLGLPLLRLRGDRWPTAPLLAVQRLAALPRVPAALALAVAVAAGTGVFAGGLAGSLQRTVDAKASVFVGSDLALELIGQQEVPPLPTPVTPVFRLADTTLSGHAARPVRVLAVDPATFAGAAFWQSSFAGPSLPALMKRLTAAGGDRLPAIAIGSVPDDPTVQVPYNATQLTLPLAVRAHASAFPGMADGPMLVVSEPALQARHPDTLRFATETLWLRGGEQPALSQVLAAGVRVRYITTVPSVSAAPSLEAVLETLDILRAFGVLAALLVLVGLGVYVDVRARRRRLASVLTRRMGLRRRTDWLSNWLELGSAAGTGLLVGGGTGIALAAYVTGLLDPVPGTPPGPLVALPLPLAAGLAVAVAGATAVVAGLGLRPGAVGDAAVLRAE